MSLFSAGGHVPMFNFQLLRNDSFLFFINQVKRIFIQLLIGQYLPVLNSRAVLYATSLTSGVDTN